MKKIQWMMILAALLCLAALLLVACRDDDPHTHEFGEWSITTLATCVAEGTRTRSCSCGESETQPLPATGIHIYNVDNICTGCGTAYVFTSGLTYQLNSSGNAYTVTGLGAATDAAIVIPPYYNRLPVTAIESLAPTGADRRVTGIHVPNTVTDIAPRAFVGCNDLESIGLMDGSTAYQCVDNCLISIAAKALVLGCKGSVIPADGSVTAIGDYAFAGRHGLSSITLPAGLASIGIGAFADCPDLQGVTFGEKPGIDTSNSNGEDPNGLVIGEWYVAAAAGATEGTKVSVLNDADNATSLKSTYKNLYWYRQVSSDDSLRY